MTDKSIDHLYARIESIVKEPHRARPEFADYRITISDESVLLMPPSAWEHSVSKMTVGDRILIDLENWEPKGWADVAIFRDGRFVTVFGIGKDVCILDLPQLKELVASDEGANTQS